MDDDQKEYVRGIYYNAREQGSFGTFTELYKRIKDDGRYNITRKNLRKFLLGEEVYTSHKKNNRLKHYPSIVAPFPRYQVEIDSAVMMFPDQNKLKYAVIAIDVFSQQIAARAVSSLKAENVNRAVNEIFDEFGDTNFNLARTDRGLEYYNRVIKRTFDRRNIRHIASFEPLKSVYAENAIRQVKRKIYKILQHTGDHNWSRHLDDVVYNLNHTKRPSLNNLAPVEVDDQHVPEIWFKKMHNSFKKQPKNKPFEYNIGDSVRIFYSRGGNFRKEFNETNGAKVFYIQDRYTRDLNHLYKLKDDRDDLVPGSFKSDQIMKVEIDDDTVWRIEGAALAYRMRNGRREALVKFLDYDDSYNQWIPAANLRDLQVPANANDPPVRAGRGRGRRRRR